MHGPRLSLTELIKFRGKKLSLIATNQRNSRKYSPSKVSRYTVCVNSGTMMLNTYDLARKSKIYANILAEVIKTLRLSSR